MTSIVALGNGITVCSQARLIQGAAPAWGGHQLGMKCYWIGNKLYQMIISLLDILVWGKSMDGH